MLQASDADDVEVELAGEHDYTIRHASAEEINNREQDLVEGRRISRRIRMQFDAIHDHDYAPPSAANVGVSVEEQEQPQADVANAPDNSYEDAGPAEVVLVTASTSAVGQLAEVNFQAVPTLPADNIDLTTSPAPSKKRKRLSKSATPKLKTNPAKDVDVEDEEDEGLTCPICLDNWEMSGVHRLVSLKCGHLFGDACIRRWLLESARQSGIKACPQCKTKATAKDIRCLYAKRLRAIDRSEEHRLRDQLDEEKRRIQTLHTELATLKVSYTLVTAKIQALENDNERMKQLLRVGGGNIGYSYGPDADPKALLRLPICKLFMERNIEISREPGCRVMVHADLNSSMIVSQKSAQSLFPGYGLRFIDTPTFRPSNFLHASGKLLRDICLSADQQLVAVASMEPRCKLFDLRSPQAAATIYTPSEKALWSCAMDRAERDHFLYLGAQHGSTYVYDIRHSDRILDEFQTEGDLSPVINVANVPASKIFPGGGFLVCKLQSLWFYEYSLSSTTTMSTRLNVEGPFISMNFDVAHDTLLISVRSSARILQSRYLFGKLEKIDDIPVFSVNVTFSGSKTTPIMTRCTQIAVEANTLIAGYIQDVKLLALFDARRGARAQSLPVQEVVFDTCPIYTPNATFLAALTETKCRIYKLTSTTCEQLN